jgi:hypothetical protein
MHRLSWKFSEPKIERGDRSANWGGIDYFPNTRYRYVRKKIDATYARALNDTRHDDLLCEFFRLRKLCATLLRACQKEGMKESGIFGLHFRGFAVQFEYTAPVFEAVQVHCTTTTVVFEAGPAHVYLSVDKYH